MSLLPFLIRTRFRLTSRAAANRMLEEECVATLVLESSLAKAGPLRAPEMLGVDEDMRDWSYYQILEHNTIVNRRVTAAVAFLGGVGPEPDGSFDIKKDVMPGESPGAEQVAAFSESVEAHLATVATIGNLRRTATIHHKLFGPFNAHQWHCLFGFHLQIHRKQAEALVALSD